MNDWGTLATAGAVWATLMIPMTAAAFAGMLAERLRNARASKGDNASSKPRDTHTRIEPSDEPRLPRTPLKLTDLGRDLVNHMDGPSWVAEESARLKHDVRKMEPYEVDLYAQEVLERHGLFKAKTSRMLSASRTLHARVSRAAYENGVEREAVLRALRVLLREELLRTRDYTGPTTETHTGSKSVAPAAERTDSV